MTRGYIQEVSLEFLNSIPLGADRHWYGLYFCPVIGEDGDYYYIACNNETGELWREEFQSVRAAMAWLRGRWVLNRQNILCDGTTGERIYDIADKVRDEIERGY